MKAEKVGKFCWDMSGTKRFPNFHFRKFGGGSFVLFLFFCALFWGGQKRVSSAATLICNSSVTLTRTLLQFMKIPKTFWRTSGGSEPRDSADRLFLSRELGLEPGQVPCSDSKVWSCLIVCRSQTCSMEEQNGPVKPEQSRFTLSEFSLKTQVHSGLEPVQYQ